MATPTQIDLDGRTYRGDYTLDGPTITVRYLSRTLSREIGRTPPGVAARGLMTQLVKMVRDLKPAA